MLKYLYSIIGIFSICACSSNLEEEVSAPTSQINVKCETFVYSMVDMNEITSMSKSRGISLSEGNLTKLNFSICDSDGKVVFSEYQTSSSENFGKISCNLEYGNYTLVAIARNGIADGGFNIKSPYEATSTINRIFDTFCATKSISITSDNVQNITMNLERAVGLFTLRQTETIPENVKSFKFYFNTQQTMKELPEVNPTTKLSVGNYQISREATLTDHKPQDLNFYAFLPANSTTVTIKVEALDSSSNIVASHVFEDIPMQVSQRSIATGDIFSALVNSGFTVNTDWLPEVVIPF